MCTTYIRDRFYLYRRKIILTIFVLFVFGKGVDAQNNPTDYLTHYDDQWIHYGFQLGVHSSKFVIKYSERFTFPDQDTVHSIVPGNSGGFKAGVVVNIRLAKYLDLRILPCVGFYENDIVYRYTDNSFLRELRESTHVELPLLLKYKSVRRGNVVMYVVGGVKPSIEARQRNDQLELRDKLNLKRWDLSADVGIGFDFYNAFFKFSPEIRYSYGLINLLQGEISPYNVGLDRLVVQNFNVFFTFEGGPPSRKHHLNKGKSRSARLFKKHKKRRK